MPGRLAIGDTHSLQPGTSAWANIGGPA
jgi:hypothetical protein